MKEYIENIYKTVCSLILGVFEFVVALLKFMFTVLLYIIVLITTPLWLIPYAIYKRVKGE